MNFKNYLLSTRWFLNELIELIFIFLFAERLMYREEQYKCREQQRGLSQLDVARRRATRRTFQLDSSIFIEKVPRDFLALTCILYLDEFNLLRLEELLQVHAAAPFEWIAGKFDDV